MRRLLNVGMTAMFISSVILPTILGASGIALHKTSSIEMDKKNALSILTNREIFVRINEIKALENPDPWPSGLGGEADFSIKITINGTTYSKSFESNKNHIAPKWAVSHNVNEKTRKVEIIIKLLDRDPDTDDVCDINPRVGVKSCKIVYDIHDGTWTGDDGGTGHSKGDGKDKPQCEIWFDIWDSESDQPLDVNILEDPQVVGEVNVPLDFHAVVSGGKPPYTWKWEIIDEYGYIIKEFYTQNITITFHQEANGLTVKVNVKDQKNQEASDFVTVYIFSFLARCLYPGEDSGLVWINDICVPLAIFIPPDGYIPIPLIFGDDAWVINPSEKKKGFEIVIKSDTYNKGVVSKISISEDGKVISEATQPYKVDSERAHYWLPGLKKGRHEYTYIVWGEENNKLAKHSIWIRAQW